jgi:uncharacterized protein YndB with AHSA1/START domain
VYAAITSPELIAKWRVPNNMTGSLDRTRQVIDGSFAITLTYTDGTSNGKSGADRDTYHSHFVNLRENELVVEQIEFESADPAMRAPMTVTTTLQELPRAVLISLTFDNIPTEVSELDNEKGTKMALTKLTQLLERQANRD